MSLPNPPNLVIGMFNYNTYTIDIVPKSTLFPTVSNIFYLVMPIITNIMYIHHVNDCSLLYLHIIHVVIPLVSKSHPIVGCM